MGIKYQKQNSGRNLKKYVYFLKATLMIRKYYIEQRNNLKHGIVTCKGNICDEQVKTDRNFGI